MVPIFGAPTNHMYFILNNGGKAGRTPQQVKGLPPKGFDILFTESIPQLIQIPLVDFESLASKASQRENIFGKGCSSICKTFICLQSSETAIM